MGVQGIVLVAQASDKSFFLDGPRVIDLLKPPQQQQDQPTSSGVSSQKVTTVPPALGRAAAPVSTKAADLEVGAAIEASGSYAQFAASLTVHKQLGPRSSIEGSFEVEHLRPFERGASDETTISLSGQWTRNLVQGDKTKVDLLVGATAAVGLDDHSAELGASVDVKLTHKSSSQWTLGAQVGGFGSVTLPEGSFEVGGHAAAWATWNPSPNVSWRLAKVDLEHVQTLSHSGSSTTLTLSSDARIGLFDNKVKLVPAFKAELDLAEGARLSEAEGSINVEVPLGKDSTLTAGVFLNSEDGWGGKVSWVQRL
jgi:hypothetical protein